MSTYGRPSAFYFFKKKQTCGVKNVYRYLFERSFHIATECSIHVLFKKKHTLPQIIIWRNTMSCFSSLFRWARGARVCASRKYTPVPASEDLAADTAALEPIESPPKKSCLKKTKSLSPSSARISFAADVKTHDWLMPLHDAFNRLMLHCLDIGGFATAPECIQYLERIGSEVGLDLLVRVPELEALFVDFKQRLEEAFRIDPEDHGVFILPGGGGTNGRLYDGALHNVNHMLVVFQHVKHDLKLKQ
jgi:hypothetical protein